MQKMFESYTIRGKQIKNRVVYPPIVMFDESVKSGVMSDVVVEHYKKVAKAGCGIMIVEATAIAKDGPLSPMQLGIWDDLFIENMAKLASIAHDEGAIAIIQLMHAGGRASSLLNNDIAAPSARQYGNNDARAMTTAEIETLQQQFVNAALRAKKAGFDGIELHSCHGFLLNQFLSPRANSRQDIYGREKTKLTTDIIKQIRKELGENFIIAIRTPGNDPDFASSIQNAKTFIASGADMLHISHGISSEIPADLDYDSAGNYTLVAKAGIEISKQVDAPVIVVNGIRTPEQAHVILEQEMVDFVAVGRGYLCDWGWVEKARAGQPVNKCVSCPKCLRHSGVRNCVL